MSNRPTLSGRPAIPGYTQKPESTGSVPVWAIIAGVVVVIVIAAGRGKRLGIHTEEIPKCLVQVGDRSILGWQMAAVAAADRHIKAGAGTESLHVFVGPGLTRLDFFGSKTISRPSRPAIEHLDTSFRPLLATNPDEDCV